MTQNSVTRSPYPHRTIQHHAIFNLQFSVFQFLCRSIKKKKKNIMSTPNDPPPSYEQATTGHDSDPPPTSSRPTRRSTIPLRARRSMEDELRPLPPGWIRQLDPATQHQFFVDTTANPPRSIWHHPYDDETFLHSLSPNERARLLGTIDQFHLSHQADNHDLSTDEDASHSDGQTRTDHRRDGSGSGGGLGQKLKDKLTGTTHAQRVEERTRRDRAEQEMYAQHLAFRNAFSEAMMSGRPQLLGKDTQGRNVYIEPLAGSGFSHGHRGYPGVTGIKRLSPWLSEVEYRSGMRPGPEGRYIRPGEDMYGGYSVGGGGMWGPPGVAYGRPTMMRMGPMGYGMNRGFLLAPIMGGLALGSLGSMMF